MPLYRDEIALDILTAMIRTGSGGTKEQKVRAAFEYANIFLVEAENTEGDGYEGQDLTRVSRIKGKSE